MSFVNVPITEMKKTGVRSVLANEPMWFAVNMGVDQSSKHGLMEVDLYDYETLAVFEQEPTVLPAWYPGTPGIPEAK